MIEIGVLLAVAGYLFFSSVEMAFASLMRLPERLEAERENEGSNLATYLDDPLKFFVPAEVLRGTLLALLLVLLAQPIGTGFSRGVILLAIGLGVSILVGQVVPALIARRSPERFLDVALPAFTLAANLIAPLTARILAWVGAVDRSPAASNGSLGQSSAPDPEPALKARADESRLLRSVVDFGETLVREVMTPRPDIVAIAAEATIDDLRQLVLEQEYSRLPVYSGNLDNIVGIFVVKDLIQRTDSPSGAQPVSSLMRPAAFVPETKRVADLLREFRQLRLQLAMVVDEYGGTAGLVTVEDVVEELVGEIRDEYDLEAEPVVQESEHSFVFSGRVAIDQLTERLGLEIDEGDFETVGGYVLARVGRVPAPGESFEADGLEVEILEAERRRIHKVRVRRRPDQVEAGV